MCNVCVHNDKLLENDHPTLQSALFLQFWFTLIAPIMLLLAAASNQQLSGEQSEAFNS